MWYVRWFGMEFLMCIGGMGIKTLADLKEACVVDVPGSAGL